MEFVADSEVMPVLREHGVVLLESEGEFPSLHMNDGPDVTRLHLATGDSTCDPIEGAQVIPMTAEALPEAVEGVIHKLHLNEVLLIPIGKWRNVFDAVAFSLATNEEWQEFEATASLKLNSRDPLACEPGDFHAVEALAQAILSDAERADQGILIAATGAPVLAEISPPGCIRMAFGSRVLADEITEALA